MTSLKIPLAACCGCCADPVVLQRIQETLYILCTQLQRSEGLIFEEYLPTADSSSKWQPAPGTVVSYGKHYQ